MNISLEGNLAALVVAALGLFLVLAPSRRLMRRPSPVLRSPPAAGASTAAPLAAKIFFRVLGVGLLGLAWALYRAGSGA